MDLQVDVMKTYLAMSSLILAFSFIFNNSIRTVRPDCTFLMGPHVPSCTCPPLCLNNIPLIKFHDALLTTVYYLNADVRKRGVSVHRAPL